MNITTFDIWDTCLSRSFSDPTHIFFEVASRLCGNRSFEDPEVAGLALMRVLAEQNSRRNHPSGEAQHHEIAENLESLVGVELGRRFIGLELLLERDSVRPVKSLLTRIDAIRKQGVPIIFISDMYLSVDFLRDLLQQHGFHKAGDFIFASGEYRANKSTGQLFHVVRNTFDLNPSRWEHCGDNLHSDVYVPRRFGIKARHSTFAKFTPSEVRAGEVCAVNARLTSRIKGGMRAARLGGEHHPVLTDVVAPWLCALAGQMVQRAKELGIRRLYFLSRDGEILLRIAKRIAPLDLECRYLYSSRLAWCFPAMFADDPACRRWLETFDVSPSGLLSCLGFSSHEQRVIFKELKLTPYEVNRRDDTEARQFVWEHLRSTGRMDVVMHRAADARKPCLAYLEQEGLFDDQQWAICDVGWSLNTQAALNRLLRAREPFAEARGMYFMLNKRRAPLIESGPHYQWILEEAHDSGNGSLGHTLRSLSGLIEEFCLTSSESSLQCYRFCEHTGKSEPVFADSVSSEEAIHHAESLRGAVDRLTSEWREYLLDPMFLSHISSFSLAELLRFLRNPTRDEAICVSKLKHASEAPNRSSSAVTLARPLTIQDVLHILVRRTRIHCFPSASVPLWDAGSRVQTSFFVKALLALVLYPIPRRPFYSLLRCISRR